ncbi:MAG: hypothetical protein IPP83_13580 [Flavobacteriales bacterium]|nr:hypothetical protein [Flavobacteriales bacterium]
MDQRATTNHLWLTSLCLLLLTVTASAQQTKTKYFYNGKKNLEYQVNAQGVPNGPGKEWDIDGRLVETGTYKNGDKDGVWTAYFRSGCSGVQSVTTYGANGGPSLGGTILGSTSEKVLSYKSYDCDGGKIVPVTTATWSSTTKAFAVIKYYPSGTPKEKFQAKDMFGMTVASGKYELYWPNAKVGCTGVFSGVKEEGMWKWFDEHGILSNQVTYATGFPVDSMAVHDGMTIQTHIDTATWVFHSCRTDTAGTYCIDEVPRVAPAKGTRPSLYNVRMIREEGKSVEGKLNWWKEYAEDGKLKAGEAYYPSGARMWKVVLHASLPSEVAFLNFNEDGTLATCNVLMGNASQDFPATEYQAKWPNAPVN